MSIFIIMMLLLAIITLFIWEPIRLDLLSLSIPFILVILQPWTKITSEEALSGFSNPATITILAMFILSRGIYKSGLVQIMGKKILDITGSNLRKQLAVTTGLSGLLSGLINNTPLVAILIPMVTDLARKTKISPSRLLIPISYASMLGGMLTLFGTSTNILASGISEKLLSHPFSTFEFTYLGFILLIIGLVYLVFFSKYLIPERIVPDVQLTEEYEMKNYLTRVIIKNNSPLIGTKVDHVCSSPELDLNLVQLIRDGERYSERFENLFLAAGDCLIIRTDQDTLLKFIKNRGIEILPNINASKNLEDNPNDQRMVELVIPHGSDYEGQSLRNMDFLKKYNSTLLAIRHGGKLSHMDMEEFTLTAGDIILMMINEESLKRLKNNKNFIFVGERKSSDYHRDKIPVAVTIMLLVVFLTAFNILPIVFSAIGGVLAMVITGCINPSEIYESINWEVIFILAGLIPLGIAMEKTGTASFLARSIVVMSSNLPVIVTLGLFYLLTVILTNIISNNASVILMIPVAVEAALHLDANPFPFLIIVTFAASSAFLTPIGYQTNLMVYGPGGYRFRDYLTAGVPLQLIMCITAPLLVSLFWGI